MASVTFKRGTKAEIESTQIQDGQLLMETDQLNNNKIYLDLPNGTRVPVGGSGAWVGTKKEFEVAVKEGKIADGTQVIITDDYESGITASMTLYSNAQSGLVATNVQSAIDEVSAKIGQENISQVGNSITGAINNLNSNFEKSNMICKIITVASNTTTFSLRYSGNESLRLPVMVFVVGQNGYVGLYSISVFYNEFAMDIINGSPATITDNGNGTITITFQQSNIWGTGFIIAPKKLI